MRIRVPGKMLPGGILPLTPLCRGLVHVKVIVIRENIRGCHWNKKTPLSISQLDHCRDELAIGTSFDDLKYAYALTTTGRGPTSLAT